MSNTLDQMKRVYEEALGLAATKNTDYGDAWRDQGWRGNLSRVFEKAKRLRTILWRSNVQPTAVQEGVRETAIDMINTLAFFIINLDAGVEWGDEAPFARTADPMWQMGMGTMWQNSSGMVSTDFPSSESIETIRQGLNPLLDTDPEGLPLPGAPEELPVRVPGEAASADENAEPERKKPTPGRRTMPARK